MTDEHGYGKPRIEKMLPTLIKHQLLEEVNEEMAADKRALLEQNGWMFGSAYNFLGLSKQEIDEVEERLRK